MDSSPSDFNNRNSKHKRPIDLESVTVITWEQDAESGAAAKRQKIHDAPFTVATEGLFSYSNMGPDVVHPTVTPAANPTLQGKFSVTEDELLRQVIADYGKNSGMTQEDIESLIFTKQKKQRTKSDPFWKTIYAILPQRDQHAIYNRVRRLLGPLARQGPWMHHEDLLLIQNVEKLGPKWSQISKRIGRDPEACRARYVDHLRDMDVRLEGAWKQNEENRLTQIVEQQPPGKIKWDLVSEQMGRTRSRIQCREKWTALNKAKQNSGKQPQWSTWDTNMLIDKLSSLALTDETAIRWNTLTWGSWTGRDLRRHWCSFKEGIDSSEGMLFPEILRMVRQSTTDKQFISDMNGK